MDKSGTGFNKEDNSNATEKTETASAAVDASAKKQQERVQQDRAEASSALGNVTTAGFDFNVDSLNLENLSGLAGLDFDVANLLRQVSSAGSGALATSTDAAAPFTGNVLGTAEGASAVDEATARSGQYPGSTPTTAIATTAGVPAMTAARSSAKPVANTQKITQGSAARAAGLLTDAAAATPGSTRPPGQASSTNTTQSASVRPGAARPTGPARPMRPVVGAAGMASTRPRPTRPPGVQGVQTRPVAVGGGGGRPGLVRAGAPGARPRPVSGAGAGLGPNAGRPGMRPGARPRPIMRPASAGTSPMIRSPTSGRPIAAVRPGMRPTQPRPPAQAGIARPPSTVAPPGAAVSPGIKTQSDQAMTPVPLGMVSGVRSKQQHGETPSPGGNAKPADTSNDNSLPDTKVPNTKTQQPQGPELQPNAQTKSETEVEVETRMGAGAGTELSAEADAEAESEAETEEHHLTETVTVTCPRQHPPVHGLDGLYDAESTFGALCHGSAPISAEWSSQNIVAVSWPQLEPTTASRRVVRRDGVGEAVGDATRSTEARREASAEIHLYRLHVHTPTVWDSEESARTIKPSLLRLCSLQMQQEGGGTEGGSDDAAEDSAEGSDSFSIPNEGTAVDVAGLSEWNSGAVEGERMHVAAAARSAWSADGRMLATSDAAGRFEVFRMGTELNTWNSEYHVVFEAPVVAWVWLGSTRKYGISRQAGSKAPSSVTEANDAWTADAGLSVRRLPFFGPRNTQGEYALVLATADGRLVLVYQRDATWERVVAPLPAGQADDARITHADMMLVSKKWIYLAAHRAAAGPVAYAHEPGALPAAQRHDGGITAPMAEIYGIQVEFEADYIPRLFATALAAAPVVVPVDDPKREPAAGGPASGAPLVLSEGVSSQTESHADPLCITHLRLVTALDPEVSHAENVLGERHSFPLVFVALGTSNTTVAQVLRLEAAVPAQRRGQALRLAAEWMARRPGVLVAAAANRAERQQLRRVFARRGDADHRALLLTWADGRVETLHDYGAGGSFDVSVGAADTSTSAWVAGGTLSPHGTAFVQLAVHSHAEQPGGAWRQGRAQLRVGWTPFFGAARVRAHSGDLLAVRVLNGEDATDLAALLANEAAAEESGEAVITGGTGDAGDPQSPGPPLLAPPLSRTLALALERASERLAAALRLQTLALDPLAGGTPHVRRLLGTAMQAHALAQHHVAASALGLLLHAAAAGEARVIIAQQHVLQNVTARAGVATAQWFSAEWRAAFPSATALVLWSIDLFTALARDAYVFFHVRCADRSGALQPLHGLDAATAHTGARGVQLPGRVPTRLALLFHQPTLEALRSMVSFASHVEFDLARRVKALSTLPSGAAHEPTLAAMVAARPLVLGAAQQLTHALAHLPVGLPRLKDFLADVHDLYATDAACTNVSAQAALLASATVTAPFARHLPCVARSFARFVLEPDVASARPPPLPSALVLHDSRWLAVAVPRSAAAGLRDGAAVFETPWRLPSAAVPAPVESVRGDGCAAREKAEFERALDEDCVLFDVDDPGFIFVDPSAAPQPLFSGLFAHAAASAAAAAPVRIAAAPPTAPPAALPHMLSDADADLMFSAPLLFDAPFRPSAQPAAEYPARVPSPPRIASRDAQHVVPHYAVAPRDAGWLFVSSPRSPRLHAPTLLARHALALAALHPPPATMAYCIDWARAAGIVITRSATLPADTFTSVAPLGLRATYGVDHVDVVQKTLLPADAPAKMCLRCGHATRRSSAASPDAAEWVRRFNVLCVCGGSWVAI
ncbi:hypothetical protein H4R24_005194 [Coemansia sp. RSA 988]|nr:hypothetical protein H4R24_005194 [Coemansia sp. RSA 988]